MCNIFDFSFTVVLKLNLLYLKVSTFSSQVIDRCKEEGKTDGNYHYFTADMGNMTSAEALIQVAIYDYVKTAYTM